MVLTPLFVGPLAMIVGGLLVLLVVLSLVRLVFGVAWRLLVIAALVIGLLWLLGAVQSGPPAAV